MTATLLVLFTVLCLLCLLYFLVKPRPRSLPPGPRAIPILGSLLQINAGKPYETFTKLARIYGPIYGLQMGSIYAVVLSEAKLVRNVFNQNAFTGRAKLYMTHGMMNGNGIVCIEGDKWKDQRKFIVNTIKDFGMMKHSRNREEMEKYIRYGSGQTIRKIHEQIASGVESVDLPVLLRHTVGNVITQLVFGRTYEEDDPIWRWLLHLQEEGVKMIGVSAKVNFLPFLRFLPSVQKIMKFLIGNMKLQHGHYRDLIEDYKQRAEEARKPAETRQNPAETRQNPAETRQNPADEEKHFIRAFLEERERKGDGHPYYTDEQFLHVLGDLFGAGLDTTLVTLEWFFLFVAKHQDVQERIHKEITAKPKTNKFDDFKSLPYTEAAIMETQRIRTVVPLGVPHSALVDTCIGEYFIPKDTMILVNLWGLHMDASVWHAPERFEPERFLDADGNVVRHDAFMPFSVGRRMCVGEQYAVMILFHYAVSILKEFHLSVASPMDMDGICGFTLQPGAFRLVVTARTSKK